MGAARRAADSGGMGSAPRTVVIVRDKRCLRALARLLAVEPGLELCGFADDAATAAAVAHSVSADLLLVDATVPGLQGVDWPAAAKQVLLVDGPPPPGAHAQVDMTRLEIDLPPLLARLFP